MWWSAKYFFRKKVRELKKFENSWFNQTEISIYKMPIQNYPKRLIYTAQHD